MNAAEVRMIVTSGSFAPRCPLYYRWIEIFPDETPARDIFFALPSRYIAWVREFLKAVHINDPFMQDFEALWQRYIDCLASCTDDREYDIWRDECVTALKQDLMARPWFTMLLDLEMIKEVVA